MGAAERIIVLGDVHANDAALWAAVCHARLVYAADEPLRFWFLGDLFGRGPDPAAAWQRLCDLRPEALIVGNHDGGLIGRWTNALVEGAWRGEFSLADWLALLDQRKELGWLGLLSIEGTAPAGNVGAWLAPLPALASPRPGVYLVHGGLQAPPDEQDSPETLGFRLTWEYLTAPEHARHTTDALSAFAAGRAQLPAAWQSGGPFAPPTLALVGHAHRRLLCRLGSAAQWLRPPALDHLYTWAADPAAPVVLSPGSAGFPRERDSRAAAYLALHHDGAGGWSATFHEATYERGPVQTAMRSLGRPAELIRLLDDPRDRTPTGAAHGAA